MQARGEGLLQPHEEVPGPELASVRVAGQLHVEARIGRGSRRSGLVREQYARPQLRRRTGESRLRVTALRRVESVGAVVTPASSKQAPS
jgi:hypothetical protein